MKFLKFFLFFLFLFFYRQAFAANLSIVPIDQTIKVGDSTNVSILVSTLPNQVINAVSGTISFPKDLLEILSISTTDSLINFWVNKPKFSNSLGTISFEGIIVNPGFSGDEGKIIKINLKAKEKGKAPLILSNASVLANDGDGTNVLEKLNHSSVTIEEEVQKESKDLPITPNITSETHPDETKWYSNKNVKVQWQIPAEITQVYSILSNKNNTIPNTLKSNPKNISRYNNLKDGIWYVHTKFKNTFGSGPTKHFGIKIDTTPPDSFSVVENILSEKNNGNTNFTISATDALSGIDHYTFVVDNNLPIEWLDDGSHIYKTNALAPGFHILNATVYDKANNSTKSNISFKISDLLTPEITEYKEFIKENEEYQIGGTAFPESKIEVFLNKLDTKKDKNIVLETKTDEKGHFAVSSEKLSHGTYDVYAKSYLENKYESAESNSVKITSSPVGLNWLISLILTILKRYLAFFIGILFLILLLLAIMLIRRNKKNVLPIASPSTVTKRVIVDSIYPSSIINNVINTHQAILEKIKSGENFTSDEHHFLSQLDREINYIQSIKQSKK
jgi:hypothetical protein